MLNARSLGVYTSIAFLGLASALSAQTTFQLTTGSTDWEGPSTDLKGKTVAYSSGGNLYLHDVKSGQALIFAAGGVDGASLSGTGRYVALESDGDHVPAGNLDGNQEIYLFDVKNLSFTQITNTTDADSERPTVDKKGRRVAFVSQSVQLGTNPEANSEVYVYNTADSTLTQITVTLGGFTNEDPFVCANGKYVYFSSDADLVPGSNPDTNTEIFRYVVKTGIVEQVTNTTNGDCENPVPNKNGKFVAFESDSDQFSGVNIDGFNEIYHMDTKKGTVIRVTNYAFESSSPSISGNGKVVTFESAGDPLTLNADGSDEVFLARIVKNNPVIMQVTSGAGGTNSGNVTLNNTGKRIFFESDSNLLTDGSSSGFDNVFQFIR